MSYFTQVEQFQLSLNWKWESCKKIYVTDIPTFNNEEE